MLLLNSCERGRTNRIERNCQLGFRSIVTWGVGGKGWYCSGGVGLESKGTWGVRVREGSVCVRLKCRVEYGRRGNSEMCIGGKFY
uniref:Uncharacterized protein n=1 Tax=Tanacetum cinerariifolium TaxID=118510 RepID=A0A6L2JUD0_TANCI|nr:hypothetical protein [Tanacetum cinerariifolium]